MTTNADRENGHRPLVKDIFATDEPSEGEDRAPMWETPMEEGESQFDWLRRIGYFDTPVQQKEEKPKFEILYKIVGWIVVIVAAVMVLAAATTHWDDHSDQPYLPQDCVPNYTNVGSSCQ